MTEFTRSQLAEGISAVLPPTWQYTAESDDGIHTFAIAMQSPTCNANFELLNHGSLSPAAFISSYKFSLIQALVELGAQIQPADKKHPDEVIATKEGMEGKIFHTFLPSTPVAHISAIYQSESDLLEVRLIAQSLAIEGQPAVAEEGDFARLLIYGSWKLDVD